MFAGPLMGNGGYTQETAEAAIAAGHADLIAFGRPYLSNPDLVERFANGWELNPPADGKVCLSRERKVIPIFRFTRKRHQLLEAAGNDTSQLHRWVKDR